MNNIVVMCGDLNARIGGQEWKTYTKQEWRRTVAIWQNESTENIVLGILFRKDVTGQ